jgi:hypothetical protein
MYKGARQKYETCHMSYFHTGLFHYIRCIFFLCGEKKNEHRVIEIIFYLFVLLINGESLLVLIKPDDSLDVTLDRFVESKNNKN